MEHINIVLRNIDILAYFFIIMGYIDMGRFNMSGWIYIGFGSLIAAIWGFFTHSWGVMLGNIAFLLMSISGFKTWRKYV